MVGPLAPSEDGSSHQVRPPLTLPPQMMLSPDGVKIWRPRQVRYLVRPQASDRY